ncbi:LexA family protein [Snodgrassella communis]|uniref:LexA family protein n=1 Tax=Snodgrassella communis TaxID=2946699 RepID=UPI00286C1F87|nr:translesion error-prone DNA polymerase V autoproteolytic subunit [Snodgrassella communis]WMY92478.1 translesion error-prone DNA polymerase V autoproteolytic subunit [Snodgrassella communis]
MVDTVTKSNRHGGTRAGAGRKAKIAGPKIVKRIPVSLIPTVEHLINQLADTPLRPAQHLPANCWKIADNLSQLNIPLATETIPAGFPSPAEPYISDYLDFNQYLIKNQAATIAVRCGGDSMHDAGISRNDLLIIDRSLTPRHRDIVMADLGNEFTIKRLHKLSNNHIELHSENSSQSYPNFSFREGDTLTIVGVVTYIIKHTR